MNENTRFSLIWRAPIPGRRSGRPWPTLPGRPESGSGAGGQAFGAVQIGYLQNSKSEEERRKDMSNELVLKSGLMVLIGVSSQVFAGSLEPPALAG